MSDSPSVYALTQQLAAVLAQCDADSLRHLAPILRRHAPRRAGPGYTGIWWDGHYYPFSDRQARVIRLLWLAWERGTPDVADGVLLRAAGVDDGGKLSDVFKGNKAWNTLIVPGPYRGVFRLAC